jgi:hypothetical protein
MVDLLDNFLNPFKLFMTFFGKRFHEIAITENGRGKERKINGGPATANQVRDGWKELKQKYLQTDRAIRTILSQNLSEEPTASYSRIPEIIRTPLVHA